MYIFVRLSVCLLMYPRYTSWLPTVWPIALYQIWHDTLPWEERIREGFQEFQLLTETDLKAFPLLCYLIYKEETKTNKTVSIKYCAVQVYRSPVQVVQWTDKNTSDGFYLKCVTEFKYLGHNVENKLGDNSAIFDRKNLFIRTNALLRRFS